MPRRSPIGLLVPLFGLAAAAAPTARDETALHLLVKAFDRVSPKNVVAVMRMSLDSPSKRQVVEVRIAKDGRQRVEVMEPFPGSGTVILELGSIRWIYNPDKRSLVVGHSMAADVFRPQERLRLVRRNYGLRMTAGVRLANLTSVVRIDATSHFPEIGGSSIFIDPDSYFVMRVDSITPSGARIRRFETTRVSYPATLGPDTFRLNAEVRTTIQESDPVSVPTAAEAARQAGFRPLSPRSLPFGFVIRKLYADPSNRTIGFNLSDGLAAATVFEFDLNNAPSDLRSGIRTQMRAQPENYFSSGRTTVGIMSNLPAAACRRLLAAFRPAGHARRSEAEKLFNQSAPSGLCQDCGTIWGRPRVTPIQEYVAKPPSIRVTEPDLLTLR